MSENIILLIDTQILNEDKLTCVENEIARDFGIKLCMSKTQTHLMKYVTRSEIIPQRLFDVHISDARLCQWLQG